jgi:hypothetical protein
MLLTEPVVAGESVLTACSLEVRLSLAGGFDSDSEDEEEELATAGRLRLVHAIGGRDGI